MEEKIGVKCQNCAFKAEADLYSSINVTEFPELKEKVLNGELFIWECPSCGKRNLLQYSTVYHDPSQRLMIWLACERNEETEAKLRSVFEAEESLKGYTARLVTSVGDLIEKVKINDAGLDDVVLEMCKYVTSLEMGKNVSGMKFLHMDGADGEITLAYPDNGEMQMLAIGFNVYEDCRGILLRNPSIKEESTGFSVVDSRWISSHFG